MKKNNTEIDNNIIILNDVFKLDDDDTLFFVCDCLIVHVECIKLIDINIVLMSRIDINITNE